VFKEDIKPAMENYSKQETRKGIGRNRKENFKGNKLLKLMQLSQNAINQIITSAQ
jgi:hypothetical protein